MTNSPPEFSKTPTPFSLAKYREWAREWIIDGELRQLSPRTIHERRSITARLFWYLEREKCQTVGVGELRAFFHYLNTAHTLPQGRFGLPRLNQPLRPVSLRGWHVVLSAWCAWMVAEEYLSTNWMKRVPAPAVRYEIKQPLAPEQVSRLLSAARRSRLAKRDEALLLFLIDTGVRVSELTSLTPADVDLQSRTFKVRGKGNKVQQGYLGAVTTKALKAYCRERGAERDDYLFESERSGWGGASKPLSRSGVQQLLERLAQTAGVTGQISPHAFRRFAAVEFLRGGGNVFALQSLLDHSSLTMTRRYCALAESRCRGATPPVFTGRSPDETMSQSFS